MCSAAIVLLTAGVGALALPTGAANAAATSGEMAPVLGNVSASHATIWSVVRDGYLDSTSLSVHVKNGTVPDTDGSGTNDVPTKVTATVQSVASGYNVRKYDQRTYNSNGWGGHRPSWTWDGKNNDGKPVKPGTYTFTVTASDVDAPGLSTTATKTITVKTGTYIKHAYWGAYGIQTTTRHHTRSCYINREYGTRKINMDCWGGRSATVTYSHTLPANAQHVRWNVDGTRGCCSNGRVVKTMHRSGSRLTITVKVTGWASYTTNGPNVYWTARVQR